MKLALVLGKQQGNTIVQRLKGIKDNLNIDVFDSIPEFIDSSIKRNSIYDRILVLSTKVTDTTLQDLYNYWGSTNKDTQVVMLSKSGLDETKSKIFLDAFKTPVAAVMLVESTTVQLIAEAVLRPTVDLTHDYGIKNFLNGELDEDVFEDVSLVKPEVKSEYEVVQKVDVQSKPVEKKNKEKRTLLGSLFGRKRQVVKESDTANQVSQNQPTPQVDTTPSNNNFTQNTDNDNAKLSQQDFIQESNLQKESYAEQVEQVHPTESFTQQNSSIEQFNESYNSKPVQNSSLLKKHDIFSEQSTPVDKNNNYTYISTPVTQMDNDFTPELSNAPNSSST